MAKKKKELEADVAELREVVRRLAAHTEVIAVALRTPHAVPRSDLDEAVAGLHRLYAEFGG
jgi:hypothetical protein